MLPRSEPTPVPLRDAPTPYDISALGAAGGRLAPSLGALYPGSIISGRNELMPLNLIAHILTFVEDDPATLAALCATGRVLHYMALPLLWRHVHLRSYSGIRSRKRTRDGELKETPEGIGGSSPFSAGLNAIVTHGSAGKLVRSLKLQGEYGEGDAELERCSRAGRVSENAMMLNICVRAALEKCTELEDFNWEIQARLLPTTYQGLARLQHLESLHVRFPASRAPQPTREIPALPGLKRLVVTDYDPLCYPDDISKVIFEARGLEDLQLHFSPRMRNAGEPSVQTSHLVRRNVMADRKIPLKRIGVYNLYAKPEEDILARALDHSTVTEFTAINCFGRDEDEASDLPSNFTDQAWLDGPHHHFPFLKVWRVDQLHRGHVKSFKHRSQMERIYMINARHSAPDTSSTMNGSTGSASSTPISSETTSSRSASRSSGSSTPSLPELYLDTICKVSGVTLQHLIFPLKWPMSAAMIAKLIRACPNLTQLSACVECEGLEIWQILMPFLKHLWAMRLKIINWNGCRSDEAVETLDDVFQGSPEFTNTLVDLLSTGDYDSLRYIGVGSVIYEVVGWEERVERIPVEDADKEASSGGDGAGMDTEHVVRKRKIVEVSREDVKHVAIWKYDTLDVI